MQILSHISSLFSGADRHIIIEKPRCVTRNKRTMDDPNNTSTSLVEFFAVVGTKYPAKYDSTYQVHPPTFYYPIINLTVILTKDSVPKNFILLEKTMYGTSGSLSTGELLGPKIYFAYERQKSSVVTANEQRRRLNKKTNSATTTTSLPLHSPTPPPPRAITEIRPVHPGDTRLLPGSGWHLLTCSGTGRPANMNTGVSGKPLYVNSKSLF